MDSLLLSHPIYPLLLFFFFTFFFLLSISLFFFLFSKRLKRVQLQSQNPPPQNPNQPSLSSLQLSLSEVSDKTLNVHHQLNSTNLPQSLIVKLLPSNSPKWEALVSSVNGCDDRVVDGSGLGDSDKTRNAQHELNLTRLPESSILQLLPSNSPKWEALFSSGNGYHDLAVDGSGVVHVDMEGKGKKKKKKRAKKNKNPVSSDFAKNPSSELGVKNKEGLVCLYPFTSSSSLTQRKIKQQYDQLVKSHESNRLTLAQVGEFVNCLVDARNELQHKSESVKRKFTITKALLLKADRSSFDRLHQQIHKLELELKRIEEDAYVYNWLQHQLKLSPAYNKMVELCSCMEVEAESEDGRENPDADTNDISFEDFLALEKKDSFWQKHGKLKSCSS